MKQTAWHIVRDDGVAGSNPATPTSSRTSTRTTTNEVPASFAPLAQLLDIKDLVRLRERRCRYDRRREDRYPKNRYGSVAEAMNVIAEHRLEGFLPQQMKVGVYYCRVCHGWHWGRSGAVRWAAARSAMQERELR